MFLLVLVGVIGLVYGLNLLSYRIMNPSIARSHRFDLNICCGKTTYGQLANVDIHRHQAEIPNFVLIDNIYHLPFEDEAFSTTLCAHTIEHVEDPKAFDAELRRVSKQVTYIVPPIWDIAAQLNFIEHQWFVLAWRKKHHELPWMVKNPLFTLYNVFFKQKVKA